MSLESTIDVGLHRNESFSASFVDEIIQYELAETDRSKCTHIKRRIIIFCVVFCTIAFFIGGGIVFYIFCIPIASQGISEICLTENCVTSAAQIISYMNKSVDPCDNFYEFACGQWIKDQIFKPRQIKIDMETMATDGLMDRLKYVLRVYVDDEPKHMRRVKTFYQDCLNNVSVIKELITPEEELNSTEKPKFINSPDDGGSENLEEKCVEMTKKIFKDAVSRLYVDEFFKQDDREYLKEMFADIAKTFEEMLNKNTWMSKSTINKSIRKLKEMEAKIGYPDYLIDTERLMAMAEGLGKDNSHTAYIQTTEIINNGNIKLISKSLNDWSEDIAGLDAVYDRDKNYFVLPAGFLQPWVYSKTYTRTMNFGKVGMIMAHEVIHGFDSEYYISQNETELVEADFSNFGSRKMCILNQYAGLVWKNIKISNVQTVAENLADIIGLKLSYMAYMKSLSKKKEEQLKLPGLMFNHKQIFFISFAQLWCDKVADSQIYTRIKFDNHAPNVFRVNGPVQNLPEFAEVFQCPLGSPMNPPIKCTIY